MSRFVNFLLYQTGWFACVLGAAWGFQWLGVCIALCLVGTHFWLAMDRALQMKLSLIAAAAWPACRLYATVGRRLYLFTGSRSQLVAPTFHDRPLDSVRDNLSLLHELAEWALQVKCRIWIIGDALGVLCG